MTAPNELDLAAYFDRIGYAGNSAPTQETVADLVRLHTEAIAFENLNPFLGQPVRIDLGSIQDKLVGAGRGGYCFEHNLLLRAVLTELGLEVLPLAARVLWGRTPDTIGARDHMLLQVRIDGDAWLVDAGFGGMTPTAPLRFTLDAEQQTPHEPFRVIEFDGDYAIQAFVAGSCRTVYRFDLQRQYPIDYEAPNWYVSTSPDSHFVTGLVAARPAPGKRYALAGRKFTIHHLGGASEQRIIADSDELVEVLSGDFDLNIDDTDRIAAAFHRLPAN